MEAGLELTGMAMVASAATLCGIFMTRLGQPAIVGYIVAGIILGPSGFAFIQDREQVAVLAELGVLMLLYFVGMEMSLRNFRRSWRLAVFTALAQVAASVIVALAIARFFGWPIEHAIFFGFVLALSSTAVAIRMLDEVGELRTQVGRVTVGVLVAQDLAVAPMLLIIGSLAGESFDVTVVFKILLSVALLAAATVFLSRRRHIELPIIDAMVGGVDLTPVAALSWCFAFAALAGFIGLSPVFGAFFAGLLVGSSAQRQAVIESAKPIQAVLLMVFFLSIGLLIDLQFLWDNLGLVLVLWLFVSIFKTALNTIVLRIANEPWQRAFLSSLVLAQLGEFSFVLGAAAIDRSVIDTEIYRLVVVVTVLSLMTSPLWLDSARRLHHRAATRPETFGQLLRLIYFREWRWTRRFTTHLADAARGTAQSLKQRENKPDADTEPESKADEKPNDTLPETADDPAKAQKPNA